MKNKIKIFYLYINQNNELYNLRSEDEEITDNVLSKERLLYLIKNNELNHVLNHKLVSLLKFNIDISSGQITNFMNNKININYLDSIKILDKIKFTCNFKILKNFNSIFLIYLNNSNLKNNYTKRINVNINNQKTRRKKTI